MDNWIAALVLAVIQGITEWIPVSSSAHLALAERLMGFEPDLTFSVALHFGTLMVVFFYFAKDITRIIEEFLKGNFKSGHGRLGLLLIIATIPVGVIGLLLSTFIDEQTGNITLMIVGWLITATLLFIGSLSVNKKRRAEEIGFKGALIIGLVQILSLFRGISRSGSTLVPGLWLGMSEKESIRFSYLLSIPVIFGANIVSIGNNTLPSNMLWATLVSFIVGVISMNFLFNHVLNNRKNLRWIALYLILLSIFTAIYFI